MIIDDVGLEHRFLTLTVKLSASQRHKKHYEDRRGTIPSLLDYLLTRYWLQVQFFVIFDQGMNYRIAGLYRTAKAFVSRVPFVS